MAMKVNLFIPCFIDQLFPHIAVNSVKLLEKFDIEVLYNKKQTCCGQPAFNSGYWKETKKMAQKLITDFNNSFPIVSPSASCTGFVKNFYSELGNDKLYIANVENLIPRLFEITDFIVNVLKTEETGASFNKKVCWHNACSALREYKLTDQPLKLLRKVKGLELIELRENDVCCGFGGTFSVKMEPISVAMVEQKVNNAIDSGAEYIASTEASCLLNIESYTKKHKLPLKSIHIVDILTSGY